MMGDPKVLDYAVIAPTRTRYRVVALAVLLAMITYLDRVCISKLAPSIMKDFALSETQMGLVFASFTLAYALFEIPTAAWADRLGTRSVLARIVVWWSAFTIATGAAWNFASLLAVRFLFGAGEAGAWPCVARTFSRWIPSRQRATIQGIFFAGAHLAGGLTPLLVVALAPHLHWRAIFAIFGVIGFGWAAAWYAWFRDDPAQHPQVNDAERRLIESDRPRAQASHHTGWAHWRALLMHRNIACLCGLYFANCCAFTFCITWLPTFLEKQHGFTGMWGAFAAGLPLTLSVISDIFGGWTSDRVTARWGLWAGRSGVGATAYVVAGAAMLAAGITAHPLVAALGVAIAVAAIMFTLGCAWGTCIDIGGTHAGVVSATMNTAGQIGAALSPVAVGFIVQHYRNWSLPLLLMGGLLLATVVCWLLIDPRKPLLESSDTADTDSPTGSSTDPTR